MGTLYVVATPIGNLEDLSPRARRVLGEACLVAAEDTRVTRRLLSAIGAHARLVSYHAHSPPSSARRILETLSRGDVALVSDAGAPGVSDPGARLVSQAAARGHPVVAVPGPSAVTAALSVSGIPADRFLFIGFLPRKATDRRRELELIARQPWPVICFEAPHRLRAALEDMSQILGARRMAVCRELTKLHEETFRGTAAEALERFAEARGEIAIVIEAAGESVKPVSETEVERAVDAAAAAGLRGRDLVARVITETNAPRRLAYRVSLRKVGS